MSAPAGPRHADFAERVGAAFTLHVDGGEDVPLVLTECTAAGPGAFSLIFKAGPDAPREQGIYELSADRFGPTSIFLVPVASRPGDAEYPLEYEAVFNSPPASRPDEPTEHRPQEERP